MNPIEGIIDSIIAQSDCVFEFSEKEESFEMLSYETSAIVVDTTAKKIFSEQDLVLIGCKSLGEIHARGNIVLFDCPEHGEVISEKSIYLFCSGLNDLTSTEDIHYYPARGVKEIIYVDGGVTENVVSCLPIVRLRNYKVGGTVLFKNEDDPNFTGLVILEGSSSIGSPHLVNGKIERLIKGPLLLEKAKKKETIKIEKLEEKI